MVSRRQIATATGLAALCLAPVWGCGGDIAGLQADGSLTAARLDSLMALPSGVYTESRTIIQTLPGTVWTVFSDFNRWRDWNPNVLQAQTTEGDALEWGLHFTQTFATKPVEVTTRNVIVRFIPGREVVWKGSAFGLHTLHAVSFHPVGDGQTEVVIRERMAGLLVFLFRERLRAEEQRVAQEALDGLRTFCETLHPIASPPAAFPSPSQTPSDTTARDTVMSYE